MLAARFYSGTPQRIFAGFLLGIALLVTMVAVLLAGCMCLTRGRI